MARLFLALDGLRSDESGTLALASKLVSKVGEQYGFKANLDYLLYKGLESAVCTLKQFRRPIFADLKMWNGERTMSSVIGDLVDLGVDYVSVYALADNQLKEAVAKTQRTSTHILAATVLSHYDDAYCRKHFELSLGETVHHFAQVALDNGCRGIILPGTTLDMVQHLTVIKVVSGVRPEWYKDSRHSEEVTPGIAIESGAHELVCGGPITKADDPVKALRQVLSEMSAAAGHHAGA